MCFCRALHNTTNSIQLLKVLGIGADIINAIDIAKANLAANQSKEAADQALKVTYSRCYFNASYNYICNSNAHYKYLHDSVTIN